MLEEVVTETSQLAAIVAELAQANQAMGVKVQETVGGIGDGRRHWNRHGNNRHRCRRYRNRDE